MKLSKYSFLTFFIAISVCMSAPAEQITQNKLDNLSARVSAQIGLTISLSSFEYKMGIEDQWKFLNNLSSAYQKKSSSPLYFPNEDIGNAFVELDVKSPGLYSLVNHHWAKLDTITGKIDCSTDSYSEVVDELIKYFYPVGSAEANQMKLRHLAVRLGLEKSAMFFHQNHNTTSFIFSRHSENPPKNFIDGVKIGFYLKNDFHDLNAAAGVYNYIYQAHERTITLSLVSFFEEEGLLRGLLGLRQSIQNGSLGSVLASIHPPAKDPDLDVFISRNSGSSLVVRSQNQIDIPYDLLSQNLFEVYISKTESEILRFTNGEALDEKVLWNLNPEYYK